MLLECLLNSYCVLGSFELLRLPQGSFCHRGRFHDDFIQTYSSAPLRAARVSKEAKYYKEYKILMFLLYFQLMIEKTLKNCRNMEKYLQNVDFGVGFFISFNFDWKVEQKLNKVKSLQFSDSFDTLDL